MRKNKRAVRMDDETLCRTGGEGRGWWESLPTPVGSREHMRLHLPRGPGRPDRRGRMCVPREVTSLAARCRLTLMGAALDGAPAVPVPNRPRAHTTRVISPLCALAAPRKEQGRELTTIVHGVASSCGQSHRAVTRGGGGKGWRRLRSGRGPGSTGGGWVCARGG